jgi:hypothetical protein
LLHNKEIKSITFVVQSYNNFTGLE